jgi:hypothetical protein
MFCEEKRTVMYLFGAQLSGGMDLVKEGGRTLTMQNDA